MADDEIAGPLGEWLTAHLDGADSVTVGSIDRPHGGYSAETLIVPAVVTRGSERTEERYVLRREVAEPPVYPQQTTGLDVEIEIQWRVMSALTDHADVPIAPLLGFEHDAEILDGAFFVMGFVDGVVPSESPSYVAEGFFVDAAPAERRRMVESGIDAMAAVHAVDPHGAGLDWLAPSGAVTDGQRQVRLWRDYADRELDGRPHDLMLAAFDRAEAEIPVGGASTLTWGDARLGNVIWHDFRPACLTDFEAAAIAPREIDVGWWLMFEQWSHATGGAGTLDGELTVEQQLDRYGDASGHEIDDIGPWVLFAAARYAAIVVRVMNRMVRRGELPADQTLYLEPIAPVLRRLLDRH